MDTKELITKAIEAREFSYSPYSNYMVGAALLTKEGEVITGFNIESASFSPSNCAERTAFFKALSEGKKDFTAIAVVGAPKGNLTEGNPFAFPCGVCRQVMREFCDVKTFKIIVATSTENYFETTLEELLPNSFGPENL